MSSKDIIVLVFALVFAGLSLFFKYLKKKQAGKTGNQISSGTSFHTAKKDDDYEPYSKK